MTRQHIAALDGLRGVAVLGVVAHHLDLLPGGYLGVDAFFVLSGFLITGILVDEAEQANDGATPIGLGAFWKRRAKRLLPALGAMLLVVLVVERWIIDGATRAADLRDETLATVIYLYNWYAIREGVDYWSSFDAPSPLRHMWSLAIEGQFYVLWPLVVLGCAVLARRRRRSVAKAVAWVAVGGALLSVAISQLIFDPRDTLRSYYGTDVRVAAILFGAAAGLLIRRLPALSAAQRQPIGVLGAVLVIPLLAAWIALDGESTLLYRGGLTASSLATAGVLAAAVLAPASLLARALSWPGLVWFGTISYGLYLWHWPIIVWLTPDRLGVDGAPLLAARIGLSLAATLLSYHLIEQPIRRSQCSGRAVAGWSITAMAGIVAFSIIGSGVGPTNETRVQAGTRDTTPIPTPPAVSTTPTTIPATIPAAAPATAASESSLTTTTTATMPPPPPLERLLIVGDSGAYFLGEPIATAATDVTVVQRGQVGCGLVTAGGGVRAGGSFLPDAAECATFPTRLQADVDAFQPTHVVFVYSWPGSGDRDINGAFVEPCDSDFDTLYRQRLTEATEIAGSTGAVVRVADTPYFVGGTGVSQLVETTDCINANIRSVVDPSDMLDLAAWTCPAGTCRLEIEGVELRPDGLHFEGPGALAAAEWIVEQLRSTRTTQN